jgi:hypothetical protein
MRGTGKTTKLLKATPQGGIFVVQNKWMTQYLQQWIKMNGRENDEIQVISVEDLDQLRGMRPRPMAIDHCVVETFSMLSPEQAEEFAIATYVAPYILKSDNDGDVQTLWNMR